MRYSFCIQKMNISGLFLLLVDEAQITREVFLPGPK
jgi:hypothetical protein